MSSGRCCARDRTASIRSELDGKCSRCVVDSLKILSLRRREEKIAKTCENCGKWILLTPRLPCECFVCFVSASGVWIKFIHLDFRMCVLLQSWGTDRKVSWNYCTQSQVRLTAFDCVEIMPRYQRCGGDVVWSTWWLPRSRGTGSNFRVLGLLELSIHWWIITKNHFVDVLKWPKSHLTRSHG